MSAQDKAPAPIDVAADAIEWVLRRVQTEANFRHYMLHTESLARLIRAYADLKGESEDAVKARVADRSQIRSWDRVDVVDLCDQKALYRRLATAVDIWCDRQSDVPKEVAEALENLRKAHLL